MTKVIVDESCDPSSTAWTNRWNSATSRAGRWATSCRTPSTENCCTPLTSALTPKRNQAVYGRAGGEDLAEIWQRLGRK